MARVTLEELKARQPTVDHERLRRTTEEEIRRHAAEDGEDIDAPRTYEDMVPPALIRRRLGLTQAEFAVALRIPVATLRNWEQGRVAPDPAARSLLRVVLRNPKAALAALAD